MLEFDANDHHFIRTFYQCEPNKEQVCFIDFLFELAIDLILCL